MKLNVPPYVKLAIVLTIVNLLLLFIRNLAVGDSFFNFLQSNLFIGSLPTLVLAIIIDKYEAKLSKVVFWLLVALWVLFYPNSPYMISDLIHNGEDPLGKNDPDLIIFDTLIVFSFAMLSVFYGFLSLKIMFSVFKRRYSIRFAHVAITATLILSSLGFYIGRELISALKLGNGKLYTWEIFLEPLYILKTVWNALWPIGEHLPAYAMMALFGIVQYMLLIMFKDVSDIETSTYITKD